MNVYFESARIHLNEIIEGRLLFKDHLEKIKESVKKRIGNASQIVICGLTSIGKKCEKYIQEYSDVQIIVWDLRDSEQREIPVPALVWEGGKQADYYSVYLVCSREDAQEYYKRIPRIKSQIVSYNELMILDERLGVEGSLLHNRKFVVECMRNIFEKASEYKEMCNGLSCEFSKELLSRWILYRLYCDIEVMRDIEDSGMPYFDPEIIELFENEVFVDAGGYDGDTLDDFMQLTKGKFKEYYFFEPEERVLEKAADKYGNDYRIKFIKKGLAEKSGVKLFSTECEDVPEMLQSDSGDIYVDVIAIDDMGIDPSFIKMDIEGAECDALDGAVETIKKHKPKLSICVYHRPNDILEIYFRMKQFGYDRIFLRADRNTFDYDVMLYALPG